MHIAHGNLLHAKGLIVHGCNAQGFMGAGVAKAVRAKWPSVYDAYRNLHQKTGLQLGSVQFVSVAPDLVVANAITQQRIAPRPGVVAVDYHALATCFEQIAKYVEKHGIAHVHFPKIGCGLAGGDWSVVQDIIERTLTKVEATLWLLPGESDEPAKFRSGA